MDFHRSPCTVAKRKGGALKSSVLKSGVLKGDALKGDDLKSGVLLCYYCVVIDSYFCHPSSLVSVTHVCFRQS